MNRSLWERVNLAEDECPQWPCPTCQAGFVILVKNSLRRFPNAFTKLGSSLPGWDIEDSEYVFSTEGLCSNPKCTEQFVLVGAGSVTKFEDSVSDYYAEEYWPLFCRPMPDVINIPIDCPYPVTNALRIAFCLLWINPSACANRLRVALENLLDHLEVPRNKIDKSGRARRESLHARIKVLADGSFAGRPELSEISEQLLSIKWLCNAGSHNNEVDFCSLLDGLEVLEYVLSEVIERPQKKDKMLKLGRSLTEQWCERQ